MTKPTFQEQMAASRALLALWEQRENEALTQVTCADGSHELVDREELEAAAAIFDSLAGGKGDVQGST